jgi:TPR repeat protein
MKKILLAFFLFYPLFADIDFHKGEEYFSKKQYSMAIFYYKKSNYQPAKIKLAKIYQYGVRGVSKRESEAIKIYLSLPDSKGKNFNLYLLYKDKGQYSKAIEFLKKAAQNGLNGANYLLGTYYYNGLYSLPTNKQLAIEYLEKSNTSEANYIIGLYYLNKEDYTMSAKYIQKSIEIDGNPKAISIYNQYDLWLYEN